MAPPHPLRCPLYGTPAFVSYVFFSLCLFGSPSLLHCLYSRSRQPRPLFCSVVLCVVCALLLPPVRLPLLPTSASPTSPSRRVLALPYLVSRWEYLPPLCLIRLTLHVCVAAPSAVLEASSPRREARVRYREQPRRHRQGLKRSGRSAR